jgi:PPOX class probable F420-dependent enzyme
VGVKLKRIARNPVVLVAPCTKRGRAVAPPWRGRARILSEEESAEAERRIQANFGAGRRIYKRAIEGAPAVYVEVVPCTDE